MWVYWNFVRYLPSARGLCLAKGCTLSSWDFLIQNNHMDWDLLNEAATFSRPEEIFEHFLVIVLIYGFEKEVRPLNLCGEKHTTLIMSRIRPLQRNHVVPIYATRVIYTAYSVRKRLFCLKLTFFIIIFYFIISYSFFYLHNLCKFQKVTFSEFTLYYD